MKQRPTCSAKCNYRGSNKNGEEEQGGLIWKKMTAYEYVFSVLLRKAAMRSSFGNSPRSFLSLLEREHSDKQRRFVANEHAGERIIVVLGLQMYENYRGSPFRSDRRCSFIPLEESRAWKKKRRKLATKCKCTTCFETQLRRSVDESKFFGHTRSLFVSCSLVYAKRLIRGARHAKSIFEALSIADIEFGNEARNRERYGNEFNWPPHVRRFGLSLECGTLMNGAFRKDYKNRDMKKAGCSLEENLTVLRSKERVYTTRVRKDFQNANSHSRIIRKLSANYLFILKSSL